ncbi:MAG: sialidase family protein [Acidobacteriota bacterium]
MIRLRSLLAVLLLSPVAAVATEVPTPSELRQQLTPTYKALQKDATFIELRDAIKALDDDRAIERYLEYLPMSPKELLEIDMLVRVYEHMVPRHIHEWHYRWIYMHQDLAKEHYGETQVRYVLDEIARVNPEPATPATDEATTGTTGPTRADVGTNRNVASLEMPAPDRYQGEIQLAVNPNNPNQIVAGANSWDTIGGTCGSASGLQAVFYSADGGDTWSYTCVPDVGAYGLSCAGGTFGSDPAIYWNDQNEVFFAYMLLCSVNGNTEFSIVTARSTDGGANWTAQGVIADSFGSNVLEDKEFLVIDNTPTSPYYERLYVCWDRQNNQKFAYSDNDGVTWTEVDLPAPSPLTLDLACDIAVDDNGDVNVIFNSLTCIGICFNEETYFTRSTNGGDTWSNPIEVQDGNLVGFSNQNCPPAQDNRCISPFGGIDIDNTGGPCDGRIYVAFSDWLAGGVVTTDVFLRYSDNNGTTWSSPVMINDDGTQTTQFHPWLVVDESDGSVVVGWHDTRNDPTSNRETDYYIARSIDCGETFEANIQVSQPSAEFNNAGISYSNVNTTANPGRNPNQYGEYLGLDVIDGVAYMAWGDSRHYFPASTADPQDENVGFAKIDFGLEDIFSDGFESGDTTAWSSTVP